jgi:hypothetical protein
MHDPQQPPPFQAPNDIFRYTTMELHSVTAKYAVDNEVVELCPTPRSREATPSSDKEALSDVAPMMPGRAARSSASNDLNGLRSWPTMMATTMRK